MRTALSLEKSLGAHDARESRRSAPATTNQTHYLGPFGQRADIALPSHCQPVAGFFISGSGNHHRHAYLLNRPEGLTPFKHTAPAFKPEVRDYENA